MSRDCESVIRDCDGVYVIVIVDVEGVMLRREVISVAVCGCVDVLWECEQFGRFLFSDGSGA